MKKFSMTLSPAEAQQLWDYIEELAVLSAQTLGFISDLQEREMEFVARRKLLRLVPSDEKNNGGDK